VTPLRSLRGRLLLAGLAGIVAGAAVAAWLLGAMFERSALEAQDRRLADDLVYVAGALARDGDGRVRLRREPSDRRYAGVFSGHYWQVGDGAEAFRSRSLWDFALALPAAPADGHLRTGTLAGPRGQVLRTAEQMLRLPGVHAPVRVWVGSDQAPLYADVARFRWRAAGGAAVLAAMLMLAAALQVRYGLRPLRGITDALARVRAGRDARLDPARLPLEVRPLAEHLNELLQHHERMVQRARESAQDLAHALKTPLAVLTAQAERPGEDLAGDVQAQVQRMRAVVERHLAVAAPAPAHAVADVAAAVQRLFAFLRAAFAGRELQLQAQVPPDLRFAGAAEDLEEMLGNLLENACKWARTTVTVDAGRDGDRLWIEVGDDGPGLAAELREPALRRGVRLDEQVPGSGLGLAIVSDVADSYGGTLVLGEAAAGGLAARLWLPAGGN